MRALKGAPYSAPLGLSALFKFKVSALYSLMSIIDNTRVKSSDRQACKIGKSRVHHVFVFAKGAPYSGPKGPRWGLGRLERLEGKAEFEERAINSDPSKRYLRWLAFRKTGH